MTGLVIDRAARRWRRQLGPVPWFVLEELLLGDATVDGDGVVVAASARSLAAAVALNKDTVVRALGVLRSVGLVVGEQGTGAGGRFGSARYLVHPLDGVTRLEPNHGAPPLVPRTHGAAPASPRPISRTRSRPTHDGTQLRLLDLLDPAPDPQAPVPPQPPEEQRDALAPAVPALCHARLRSGEVGESQEGEPC